MSQSIKHDHDRWEDQGEPDRAPVIQADADDMQVPKKRERPEKVLDSNKGSRGLAQNLQILKTWLGKAINRFGSSSGPPIVASFIVFVLLPSFAATLYFVVFASDQPSAEARFTVRQIETELQEGNKNNPIENTGVLSGNSGFSLAGQNAFLLTSYIDSRAIVDDLSKLLNLREIFRRPEADFWARLKEDATVEELTDYWRSMTRTYIDGPSGIVTLRIRAFRSDDAVRLVSVTLQLSEMLVNQISDRARRDAIAMAQEEVRRTFKMTQDALGELRIFRNSVGMIDPVEAGSELGKLLFSLVNERIRLENELFVLTRTLDANAPTVRSLKTRLEGIEVQISEMRAQLTSPTKSSNTITASLARFEELELQRQFAEKLYTLAQADLDRARQRAERQTLYLTVFVPPSLPEESQYPRRIAFPLLTFIGLGVLWAIGAMIYASIEDHRL